MWQESQQQPRLLLSGDNSSPNLIGSLGSHSLLLNNQYGATNRIANRLSGGTCPVRGGSVLAIPWRLRFPAVCFSREMSGSLTRKRETNVKWWRQQLSSTMSQFIYQLWLQLVLTTFKYLINFSRKKVAVILKDIDFVWTRSLPPKVSPILILIGA